MIVIPGLSVGLRWQISSSPAPSTMIVIPGLSVGLSLVSSRSNRRASVLLFIKRPFGFAGVPCAHGGRVKCGRQPCDSRCSRLAADPHRAGHFLLGGAVSL